MSELPCPGLDNSAHEDPTSFAKDSRRTLTFQEAGSAQNASEEELAHALAVRIVAAFEILNAHGAHVNQGHVSEPKNLCMTASAACAT